MGTFNTIVITNSIVQTSLLTAFLTFFFGFGAGALLNLYMIRINHPLVTQFRASLTFISAIIGDGILLPIVNAIIVAFLIPHALFITPVASIHAILIGLTITLYFHLMQGFKKIVNWSMPTPWNWNILGVWHAGYMFTVLFLLSLFYLVAFRVMMEGRIPWQVAFVSLSLGIFCLLLKYDYRAIDLFK